jgi:single-stranded-DNA-specific exonuclease
MNKRWNVLQVDENKVQSLFEALKIHRALCRILVARGIETFEQAKLFFRPELSHLHDPFLMKGMHSAVDRIQAAMDRGERILVYGDYDVDGTTAVSCVFRFLEKIYPPEKIDYYIPHRYREGYGISKAGIEHAYANGFSLVISLDCGIKSVDLIGYAATLGIDFIVCDHHLPDAELPPAYAILNPKQHDCPYPYKELCGCGIGFKLITALAQRMNLPGDECYCYLDMVATAIAADIVPVTGENRVLAYYGLKRANEDPCNGIKALTELSGLKKTLLINNLVFMIAPRVNAAGRMDDARKAVQMFVEKDYTNAYGYAQQLHSDNSDRREADSNITGEALELLRSEEFTTRKTTVVYRPHWHKGVVGIVASRLIEHYYRPTIVLTQSGDVIAGSARSVNGFNLYEAIHACREHLLGYGGHFAAAGMTMMPEQLDAFSKKFEDIVASTIQPQSLEPELVIDTEINFKDLTNSLYNILCQMQPFGPDNMQPVLLARDVMDTGYSRILKDQHIRFSLRQGQVAFTGVGFNMADKFHLLQAGRPLNVVFTLDENEWNGNKHLQLKVIDLRPASS